MVRIKLERVCIEKKKGIFECRYIPYTINKPMHWAVKRKWKLVWEEEVNWTVYKNRKKFGKLPLKYAKIEIVYHQTHISDTDNMYGSVKPVVDGLVKAGVIIDDKPKYLDLTVTQRKAKSLADQHVEIIIR